MILLYIIIATVAVSLISLLGVLLFFKKENNMEIIRSLVSLAAGSMLAVSFLDLLPEALEESNTEPHYILGVTLLSILLFFVFERILHWHHCHDEFHHELQHKKHFAYLNLTGDAIHNLIDGALIAGAFMLNTEAGIMVALAVVLHEIPQEISDFGVLLYAGLTRTKAILFNLYVGIVAVIGAVLFYFFGSMFETAIPFMAAIAAGNFIYLATADIMPELYHEKKRINIVLHTAWLIVGVIVIYFVGQLTHQ